MTPYTDIIIMYVMKLVKSGLFEWKKLFHNKQDSYWKINDLQYINTLLYSKFKSEKIKS